MYCASRIRINVTAVTPIGPSQDRGEVVERVAISISPSSPLSNLLTLIQQTLKSEGIENASITRVLNGALASIPLSRFDVGRKEERVCDYLRDSDDLVIVLIQLEGHKGEGQGGAGLGKGNGVVISLNPYSVSALSTARGEPHKESASLLAQTGLIVPPSFDDTARDASGTQADGDQVLFT